MRKLSELKVPYTIAEWATLDKKDYFVSVNDLREWAKEWIKFIMNGGETGSNFWCVDMVKGVLMDMFEIKEEDLK